MKMLVLDMIEGKLVVYQWMNEERLILRGRHEIEISKLVLYKRKQ